MWNKYLAMHPGSSWIFQSFLPKAKDNSAAFVIPVKLFCWTEILHPFPSSSILVSQSPISVQREPYFNFRDGIENICLSISCPRRDREFLSSSLMLRDEIEIFFLSISCFETRSRISFFQSRASRWAWEFFHLESQASRREREILSFRLSFRDENGNFLLSISCFETSTRIFPPYLRLRDESEKFCHLVSVFETRTGFFLAFIFV